MRNAFYNLLVSLQNRIVKRGTKIALIYEIQGRYADAVKTYDRIVQNLAEEWNFTEGETVNIVLREKQRLVEMM